MSRLIAARLESPALWSLAIRRVLLYSTLPALLIGCDISPTDVRFRPYEPPAEKNVECEGQDCPPETKEKA